jgi:hypothetical protein
VEGQKSGEREQIMTMSVRRRAAPTSGGCVAAADASKEPRSRQRPAPIRHRRISADRNSLTKKPRAVTPHNAAADVSVFRQCVRPPTDQHVRACCTLHCSSLSSSICRMNRLTNTPVSQRRAPACAERDKATPLQPCSDSLDQVDDRGLAARGRPAHLC